MDICCNFLRGSKNILLLNYKFKCVINKFIYVHDLAITLKITYYTAYKYIDFRI